MISNLYGEEKGNVREPTSKEVIYNVIKKKIFKGNFSPGHFLRIASLASEFNVSLTPVREALYQLEGEGLIDFLPYKGAVVKAYSRKEVRELYDIRTILECAALERAIPSLSNQDIKQAEELLDSIIGITDPEVLNLYNWRFHSLIFRCSGMPMLCDMIESLRSRVTRYLHLYYAIYAENFERDHRSQLEIYKSGNVAMAIEHRKSSVESVLQILLKLIPEE